MKNNGRGTIARWMHSASSKPLPMGTGTPRALFAPDLKVGDEITIEGFNLGEDSGSRWDGKNEKVYCA